MTMKTKFKKCAALAVIFGISAFSFAGMASAQSTCKWYALQSAKQQKVNLRKGCNLKGSEWSKNIRDHKAYCESVSPDAWQAKIVERQKALDACK